VLRVGLLVDRALRAAGVIPDAVLGTSLGEWSALISSGALGSQVQNLLDQVDPDSIATPDLTFLAVGRGAGEVTEYLAGQRDVVVSHDNAPDRCIVCGTAEGVRRLAEELRPRGVLTRELPFRSGFHTPMFAPYAAPFRAFIETVPVAEPEFPVWSATTASCHLGPAADVRAIFLNHLIRPVRLRQTVEAMYTAGFRVFVQAGLGQVASMIDETLGDREHLAVEAASASRNGMSQLRRAMAALWVEGLAVGLPVPEPSASSASSASSAGLAGQAGAEVALDLSST
jgi:acyl transferase domain-containing protein